MKLFRFAVLTLLLCAINVSAQTVTGSLSGTVVDSTAQVVPGANVTAVHENSGEERTTITNGVGDFMLPGLTPGPYTIRVTLAGFKPLEVKSNVVQANN